MTDHRVLVKCRNCGHEWLSKTPHTARCSTCHSSRIETLTNAGLSELPEGPSIAERESARGIEDAKEGLNLAERTSADMQGPHLSPEVQGIINDNRTLQRRLQDSRMSRLFDLELRVWEKELGRGVQGEDDGDYKEKYLGVRQILLQVLDEIDQVSRTLGDHYYADHGILYPSLYESCRTRCLALIDE